MSVVAFCAATAVANTLAAQTAASAALEMEDKRNIVNATLAVGTWGFLSKRQANRQDLDGNQ
jgi:hypothetical protein